MDFILSTWQFFIAIGTILLTSVVGFVRMEGMVKNNQDGFLSLSERMLLVENKISHNDKGDAVMQQKVKDLSDFKAESTQNKDLTLRKLSSIEAYVKSINSRLDKIENKVNK
jgi:hypothetical protein|tara:strand:+ start:187 stop:522 length:336 start_codon:yes stop_codon:yes gene_type:complete